LWRRTRLCRGRRGRSLHQRVRIDVDDERGGGPLLFGGVSAEVAEEFVEAGAVGGFEEHLVAEFLFEFGDGGFGGAEDFDAFGRGREELGGFGGEAEGVLLLRSAEEDVGEGGEGRFLSSDQPLLLAVYRSECESHASNWGGSLIFAKRDGGLVFNGYHPGLAGSGCLTLPKRESVWWGCLCIRGLKREGAGLREGLAAAENWVRKPEEEQRRAAGKIAEDQGFNGAGAWIAFAAFTSGGSLAPPDLQAVPPPADSCGRSVFAAIMQATRDDDAFVRLANIRCAIDSFCELAKGGEGTKAWAAGPKVIRPEPHRQTA